MVVKSLILNQITEYLLRLSITLKMCNVSWVLFLLIDSLTVYEEAVERSLCIVFFCHFIFITSNVIIQIKWSLKRGYLSLLVYFKKWHFSWFVLSNHLKNSLQICLIQIKSPRFCGQLLYVRNGVICVTCKLIILKDKKINHKGKCSIKGVLKLSLECTPKRISSQVLKDKPTFVIILRKLSNVVKVVSDKP